MKSNSSLKGWHQSTRKSLVGSGSRNDLLRLGQAKKEKHLHGVSRELGLQAKPTDHVLNHGRVISAEDDAQIHLSMRGATTVTPLMAPKRICSRGIDGKMLEKSRRKMGAENNGHHELKYRTWCDHDT